MKSNYFSHRERIKAKIKSIEEFQDPDKDTFKDLTILSDMLDKAIQFIEEVVEDEELSKAEIIDLAIITNGTIEAMDLLQ